MKILHLGDLHLGIKFHKRDILEDQKHVLQQVVEIADKEKACVVIAGDVYDTINPSVAAQMLWFEFLNQLGELNKKNSTRTLVIDGNHDSALRLRLGSQFLKEASIHLITGKPNSFNQELNRTPAFHCLPHVKPSTAEQISGKPFDSYDEAYKYMLAGFDKSLALNDVNVLITHQTFEGGVVGESEFKPFMSDAISSKAVAKDYDLVLSGHLHAHQKIGNIYYSGSLLPYAFGDDYQQSVSVFEWVEGEFKHKRVPIDILHPLKEISGNLSFCLKQEADGCYVKVKLVDCSHFEEALAKLQQKFPLLLACINSDGADNWEADLDKPVGTFGTIKEAIDAFTDHVEIPRFSGKRSKMIEEAIDAYSEIEN